MNLQPVKMFVAGIVVLTATPAFAVPQWVEDDSAPPSIKRPLRLWNAVLNCHARDQEGHQRLDEISGAGRLRRHRRRGNGRGRRGCFSPGSSATTHLCGIVASDLSPQYWRHSRVLFLLLMGSPIIGPPKRTRKKPRSLVVPPVTSGASSISMPSTRPFTAPVVCRTFAAFREGQREA